MSTLERIKNLCEDHGITVSILEERLDIPHNTIYQWKTGKRNPNLERLQKVADYFNVSTDYLLGRTEDRLLTELEMDEETRTLARNFQELDDDSKDLLKQLIKSMSKKGKEAKRE